MMRYWIAGLMLVVVLGCGAAQSPAQQEEVLYRVNCGATTEYTDGNGVKWLPDQVLEPGKEWGSIGGGIGTREKDLPIHDKVAPELSRNEHFGIKAYEFNVPNGTYTVKLHFAECHDSIFAAGLRVFDISVGPGLELKGFDPYKEAGGFAVPVVMVFAGRAVTDGKLRIDFTPKSESACIDAIEIAKTGPAEPKITKVSSPELPLPVRKIEPPADSKPKRILFVGNSLTIRWDLPGTVQGLINSAPGKLRVVTFRSVQGGANLDWHYNHSKVLDEIKTGHYDYVVLQEYIPTSTEKMLDLVGKFDQVIRESGAKTLLYCTWVHSDKTDADQNTWNEMQMQVGRTLKDTFVPAGPAWQAVRRDRPDFVFYTDQIHPTLGGSYLAACVFYSVLTGESPEGNPFTAVGGGQVEVDKKLAAYMQKVAWETVKKYGDASKAPE